MFLFRQKTTQNLCEVEIKDESSNEAIDMNQQPPKSQAHSSWHKTNTEMEDNHFDGISNASMHLNGFATAGDAINLLKSTKTNQSNDELKILLEMHVKEHHMRMDILKVKLETAKFNRDIAEINKMMLLRSLQNDK